MIGSTSAMSTRQRNRFISRISGRAMTPRGSRGPLPAIRRGEHGAMSARQLFMKKSTDFVELRGLLMVAILLMAWEATARISASPFFPTLETVMRGAWELIQSGD